MTTLTDGSVRRRPEIVRSPEAAFVLLGVGAALLLLARVGWRSPVTLEVTIGTALYLVALLSAVPCPVLADPRVRLGINYLCALWLYGATSRITTTLGHPSWDTTLLAADRCLFGETPAVARGACAMPRLVTASTIFTSTVGCC